MSRYRVEQQEDGLFHLFIKHVDGSEYELGNGYQYEATARMDGYVSTLPQPTTEDGVRQRRRFMRAV